MLGHDVPFAYFHAIAMTQDPKIYNKRTGMHIDEVLLLCQHFCSIPCCFFVLATKPRALDLGSELHSKGISLAHCI